MGPRDPPPPDGAEGGCRGSSGEASVDVVLDCEYQGRLTDPWGKTRAGFSFRTEIDLRKWGLKWNQALETGGVLVANKVRVEGELQFVRQEE
jgi:YceI-like protein